MPKLSDTQLVILSGASQRDDGAVLPLPPSLTLNKGAAASVFKSLVKRGLVAEESASQDQEAWREAKDGQRMTLVITDAGLDAIGVEPDQQAKTPASSIKPTPAR